MLTRSSTSRLLCHRSHIYSASSLTRSIAAIHSHPPPSPQARIQQPSLPVVLVANKIDAAQRAVDTSAVRAFADRCNSPPIFVQHCAAIAPSYTCRHLLHSSPLSALTSPPPPPPTVTDSLSSRLPPWTGGGGALALKRPSPGPPAMRWHVASLELVSLQLMQHLQGADVVLCRQEEASAFYRDSTHSHQPQSTAKGCPHTACA
jgi:hypothetical protein